MVFSSLYFVYAFFTLNMAVILWMKSRKDISIEKQNIVMLLFSLFFYAWGGPPYLLLLAGETLVSWFAGIRIGEAYSKKRKNEAKTWLIAAVAIMLGLLCIFKYLGLIGSLTHNFFGLFKSFPEIALPIGISFYTFQLISYVADVYNRRVEAQPVYYKLLLYAGLYHQCVAGPIVRYKTVAEEIDNRKASYNDFYSGIRRFSVGLAKKAVLANSCAAAVAELLPDETDKLAQKPFAAFWLGMIFFTFQIYFDFSAYSDMAIGMGRMIGFHYDENFNYPYMAVSVQDFWRRWHISLSTFFRDYVYIPLGGSREGSGKYIRNMVVVWFLTGLWHGASVNYILWGLYFLGLLLFEKFVLKNQVKPVVSRVLTLIAIVFGWAIFKFENLKQLGTVIKGMFGFAKGGFTDMGVKTTFFKYLFFFVFCFIAATPLGKNLTLKARKMGRDSDKIALAVNIIDAALPVIMLLIATFALAGDNYNPFLYFRF